MGVVEPLIWYIILQKNKETQSVSVPLFNILVLTKISYFSLRNVSMATCAQILPKRFTTPDMCATSCMLAK